MPIGEERGPDQRHLACLWDGEPILAEGALQLGQQCSRIYGGLEQHFLPGLRVSNVPRSFLRIYGPHRFPHHFQAFVVTRREDQAVVVAIFRAELERSHVFDLPLVPKLSLE